MLGTVLAAGGFLEPFPAVDGSSLELFHEPFDEVVFYHLRNHGGRPL